MAKSKVKLPSPATLKKYGLSLAEWKSILKRQGYVCPICKKAPTSGRFCVDHEHVVGWKHLPPEERKKFVRGLACYFCNRFYMAKAITISKAENVIIYLTQYQNSKL